MQDDALAVIASIFGLVGSHCVSFAKENTNPRQQLFRIISCSNLYNGSHIGVGSSDSGYVGASNVVSKSNPSRASK